MPHDLSTESGYCERYYELLFEHRTDQAPARSAWQQLEAERLRQVGKKRMKYTSFRVYLCRRNSLRRSVVSGKV